MNMLLDGVVITAAVYIAAFGVIVAKETYEYMCDYVNSLVVKKQSS